MVSCATARTLHRTTTRRSPRRSYCLLALGALMASGAAQAELYCVATSTQLLDALVSARGGGASEIRIRTGSYNVVGGSFAALNVVDATDLAISGGWNAACTAVTATSPDQTLLNAQSTGRLLEVNFPQNSANQVSFSYLRFQGGVSATPEAGCVTVLGAASANARVLFDINSFRLCSNDSAGSALRVRVANTQVFVRGNLFVDNASNDGALQLASFGNSTFYATNNTLTNNLSADGAGGINFVGSAASDTFAISNNVVWANGPAANRLDISLVGSFTGTFSNNLIGASSTIAAGLVNSGTLTINPGFVSSGDFRPGEGSPLRNSGTNSAPGGNNFIDFDFAPRQQGPRVDRGAFEFREIFANGFE